MTAADTAPTGVLIEDARVAQMCRPTQSSGAHLGHGGRTRAPTGSRDARSSIDGVALRTALNMAVMGFAITDLLIGTGLIIVLAGTGRARTSPLPPSPAGSHGRPNRSEATERRRRDRRVSATGLTNDRDLKIWMGVNRYSHADLAWKLGVGLREIIHVRQSRVD